MIQGPKNDPESWKEWYITYGELYNSKDFEFFTRHFKTPSGDEMVAWGYYDHN